MGYGRREMHAIEFISRVHSPILRRFLSKLHLSWWNIKNSLETLSKNSNMMFLHCYPFYTFYFLFLFFFFYLGLVRTIGS